MPSIAMWSGPRNISTAMMRSFGNRRDTFVCDEPFYAHYLLATGSDHPGAAEVIAHHETRCAKIIAGLTGPVPEGKRIFYQKHMAHHLLPEIDRGWLEQVSNCFLIRSPRQMLTSLVKFLPEPGFQDTGLPQQVEIFRLVRDREGRTPPVIDARDVLGNPRRMLGLLCTELQVEFTEAMLSWPPGRRATDGIWARYWYDSVEASTSFKPYVEKGDPVPRRLAGLYDECMNCYEELYACRLGQ